MNSNNSHRFEIQFDGIFYFKENVSVNLINFETYITINHQYHPMIVSPSFYAYLTKLSEN